MSWKNSSYRSLEDKKEINLEPYSVVKEEGDWKKGLDVALEEVLKRLGSPPRVRERAKEVKELVVGNPEEFSGRSRVVIATVIVYLSYELEGEEMTKDEMVRETGITGSSLRKYIEGLKEMWES